LDGRDETVPGAAVFAGIEGTRPILVEIQALAAPSSLATPRRAVVGWDNARLSMVLAVLEARCGMSFAGRDVFLNIAGGIRITEPAADLAVAAALISSLANVCIPKKSVFFGEISLSGAVRPVNQTALRLRESEKLGFETAFLSKGGSKGGSKGNTKDEKGSQLSQDLGHSDLNIRTISDLAGLISLFKLESSET